MSGGGWACQVHDAPAWLAPPPWPPWLRARDVSGGGMEVLVAGPKMYVGGLPHCMLGMFCVSEAGQCLLLVAGIVN